MKKISYIIVTFNSQDHFPDLINSLREQTPYPHEFIIVDNASTSTAYLRGADRLVKNVQNLMFTPAANIGIEQSDPASEYIILTNPDIRITENTISTLIDETERLNAGIAAPVLCYPDLTVQHGGGLAYEEIPDDELLAMDGHAHQHFKDPLQDCFSEYPKECRWITGAFFLITRAAYQTLGPLDNSLTHYKSDLEYCLRARREGEKVICSSAIALHFHKKSTARKRMFDRVFGRLRYRHMQHTFEKNLRRFFENTSST